jgi:hypothetical protein
MSEYIPDSDSYPVEKRPLVSSRFNWSVIQYNKLFRLKLKLISYIPAAQTSSRTRLVTVYSGHLHNISIYRSISIPVAPTWSIGHPGNASFHFSFLITSSWLDPWDGGSDRCKAATYTGQNKHRIHADKYPCLE